MNIPRIQIRQQYAKIAMDTKKPQVNIKQKKADMDINQKKAWLEMNHKDVRIKIDNYPHRYDLGMKNPTDARIDFKNYVKQQLMNGISRVSNDGDRIMNLKNKGDGIPRISAEESAPKQGELSIKWLRGPNFNVEPAELNINVQAQKPVINVKINKPEFNFDRGKVDIRMAQYSNVDIWVKGSNLDTTI